MSGDLYDLHRFVFAQYDTYETALEELPGLVEALWRCGIRLGRVEKPSPT